MALLPLPSGLWNTRTHSEITETIYQTPPNTEIRDRTSAPQQDHHERGHLRYYSTYPDMNRYYLQQTVGRVHSQTWQQRCELEYAYMN